MIGKLIKFMNNIMESLIKMGECCQRPPYLENYLHTVPDIHGNRVGNSLVDRWEKEIAQLGSKSKVAELEESPALSSSVIGDEILVSK